MKLEDVATDRLPLKPTRRACLRIGAWGGVSLALGGSIHPALNAASTSPIGRGRAKSILLVFANGGQSHLDMWDPKPDAPLDVRGEFGTIATAIPGVRFGEHLPRTARVADRLTIVRSMSHEDLDHGSAVYLALTGCYHARRSGNPPPSPFDAPTYGALLRRVRPSQQFIHDAIHVNGPVLVPTDLSPGQNAGYLGSAFDPLVVGNPNGASGAIPGLTLHNDLPLERFRERLYLKNSLDALAHELDRRSATPSANAPESSMGHVDSTIELDRLYAQAYAMLASPKARRAFDLDAEPATIRERYGVDRSGQSLLLARRLVEAEVPLINVIWNHSNRGQDLEPDNTDQYGWDTHNDIFDALKNRLLPRFDVSFSALIEDLDQRGLLAQTLVVCMGEFGRAPRVAIEPKFKGASPGRKHWSSAYSIVMAGAGVRRGAVVGATDRMGGEPTSERYGPWDVAATMFHALGIAPDQHYTDSLDRTFPLTTGHPIREIYQDGT